MKEYRVGWGGATTAKTPFHLENSRLYSVRACVCVRDTLRAAAAQCIVMGPVCGWVCYHDNSKLRVSIFTKLGL